MYRSNSSLAVSSVGGSRLTLNSTTSEKNTGLGHLKLVLFLINDNIKDVGLERKLKLDDFNHLTSNEMLKIVTFLLRDVMGEMQIHQTKLLPNFGVGHCTYDSGIDEIYHAIKPLFPEDNDIFHYSVLLMPALDPKRTKWVITHILSFVLMCDNLKDQFAETHEEILEEIKEDEKLFEEVNNLKNAITDKIQANAVEANRMPVLKREIQQVLESIDRAQLELAKWNGKIETLTGAYQHEKNKIQRLNQKLHKIQVELRDLKECIVNDPNKIKGKNEAMKKQFRAESGRREVLAGEIEKIGNERLKYKALNQRAKITAHNLETEVSRLVVIREQIELQTNTVNDTVGMKSKIVRKKKGLSKLVREFEGKRADLHRRTGEQERELNELVQESNNAQEAIKNTKGQINVAGNALSEVRNEVDIVLNEINKIQELLRNYVYEVNVNIPTAKQQLEAEAEQLYEKVVENFCHYPELPQTES